LWAALIRLAAGVIILLVWIIIVKPAGERFTIHRKRDMWRMVFAATFIGTYVAIWLQQAAFKFTVTGIAQTLISTSPLFVLPFAVRMGEKVTLRAVAGVAVALLGIALLFGVVL
jgi:drug/metabolite transporter (DMT)-like permease